MVRSPNLRSALERLQACGKSRAGRTRAAFLARAWWQRTRIAARLALVIAITTLGTADPSVTIYELRTTAAVPISVAAGDYNSVALRSDGTVYDWGDNSFAQLGNGTLPPATSSSSAPVQVVGLSGAVAVASGWKFALALKSDGTVWGWGNNAYGELGTGIDGIEANYTPVAVQAHINGVTAIAVAEDHSLSLKADGTVWGYGHNQNDTLGDTSTGLVANPTQIGITGVTAISASGYFSLALKGDGSVWAWGDDSWGELGNGTITNTPTPNPVQVSISGVMAIAAGQDYALALKTDGTLWAWGSNQEGQLGNSSKPDGSLVPVQVMTDTGAALNGVTALAAGQLTGYARTSDGALWAWGLNSYGQVGVGTSGGGSVLSYLTATKVAGLTGVTDVAGGRYHALAVTGDGSLWAWGHNQDGELGNGTNTDSSLPVTAVWAPTSPQSPSATPEDGAATVTWQPPKSSGAGRITSYTITSSDGQQTTVTAPVTTTLVNGLTPGATYTFTVTATNDFGTSTPSTLSNVVMALGPPAAPIDVSAVAGNAQVTIVWQTPAANGSPITQYVVTPFVNGTAGGPIPTGSTATTYTVSGVANGVTYSFEVAAQNMWGVGVHSTPSNAATPDVLPGPPGAPNASPGNGQAMLTWAPPIPNGGSAVQQYVATAIPANGTTPVTLNTNSDLPTYTFSGLHNGVTYTFTVAAQNGAGIGATSQPSNAVTPSGSISSGSFGSVNGFSFGELQDQTSGQSGCGANSDLEPQVILSASGTALIASERGIGGGSDVWRVPNGTGGPSANGCSPTYVGQPNAVSGKGASGGDVAVAAGSAPASGGSDPVYVASLNQGSVSVAHSTDDGQTFINAPIQGSLPDDDRPWIAAYGSSTSLLSFRHGGPNVDLIDVLRSDDGGAGYVEISQPIPATDYRATDNQIGSLVIDHRTTAGVSAAPGALAGFWAYQAFVAPSSSNLVTKNELFVAVSSDGGFTWSIQPVGCSRSAYGLDNVFPVLSVDPSGTLWAAWADPTSVYTAVSSDHGGTWACSASVSRGLTQAVMPTLVATSAGVDLAYYGTPTPQYTWSVYFVQNLTGTVNGWGPPLQLNSVHSGYVCVSGDSCSGNRQLYDDFGIEVDASGWAHIAYSHDAPSPTCNADLGCDGTYTGYLVQTSGTEVGYRN